MSEESGAPKPEYVVAAQRLAATCARLDEKSERWEAMIDVRSGRTEAMMNRAVDRIERRFKLTENNLGIVENKLYRLKLIVSAIAILISIIFGINLIGPNGF